MATVARWLAAVMLPLMLGQPAHGLDNPDAPDRAAAFIQQATPYEERLAAQTGAPGIAQAAGAYAAFLDAELNRVYQRLLTQVDAGARRRLVASQRAWLAFYKAESDFITANWTPQTFGSSSALSRAQYRSTLVRQRILDLLRYQANYADGDAGGRPADRP